MKSSELAIAIAEAADDKGADDIVVLDVSGILGICDHFVIASARNTRLVGAVAGEIEEQVFLGHDLRPAATEGLDTRRWVLIDYGDVIAHVFLDEERAFYRLERLYGDAPRVDWGEATRRSPAASPDLTA